MGTAWILHRGEYSDYRVVAVFVTEADARAAMAMMNTDRESPVSGSEYEVSELPSYAEGEQPKKVTTYHRAVRIWDDGSTSDEREDARVEWECDTIYGVPSKRPTVRWNRWSVRALHKSGCRLEVSGSDRKAVDQAFSDNRARLIAESDLLAEAVEPL